MIRSFGNRSTEQVFFRQHCRGLAVQVQRQADRKLRLLHVADTLTDLKNPPGNRLEKLHGDREGQYSIRINSQWRLCFVWRHGDAFDVEIVDYH